MSALESIVLPLAESRALAEAGIVLDTALVWIRDNDDQHISVVERSRTEDILDLKGEATVLCGAWVLSELLDAIRAKCPYAVISIFHREGFGVDMDIDDDSTGVHDGVGMYLTDLLAAAALLREVSK